VGGYLKKEVVLMWIDPTDDSEQWRFLL